MGIGLLSLLLAFAQSANSQARTPATQPPSEPELSVEEAHRFLIQASFGPRPADIAALQSLGFEAWLDVQLNAPSAYDSASDGHLTHLERTIEIAELAEPNAAWWTNGFFNGWKPSKHVYAYQFAAYLDNVLGSTAAGHEAIGSDLLRQRVGYAWNELMVVPVVLGYESHGETMAQFADVLAQHALGDFRAMLTAISKSPSMGIGLSSHGNAKRDLLTGQRPDENYAREVMQLFSIGLFELNLDGSPNRDGDSHTYPDAGTGTIPSYDQADVVEFAKIMTGWDIVGVEYFGASNILGLNMTLPMEFTAAFHEDEVAEGGDGFAEILGVSVGLNSGSDGSGLDAAINVLINHPNTAPFLAKHLITNLVTANPRPAYIARVAAKFEDDGNGVRGNLGAMARQVLLDQDARASQFSYGDEFGLVKEPFLAFMQALRAAEVQPLPGWIGPGGVAMHDVYWFANCRRFLLQAPVRSPSPFNFFHPDFIPADEEFVNRELRAPSLQIQTGEALIGLDSLFAEVTRIFEKNAILAQGVTLEQFGANYDYKTAPLYVVDLSEELQVFEIALDGSANGDFLNINVEADKRRAIRAMLRRLGKKYTGKEFPDTAMSALTHYLMFAAGANAAPGMNAEEARRVAREAVRMLVNSPIYRIQK
jgi:uncharacterized protein (DUF1800 family)